MIGKWDAGNEKDNAIVKSFLECFDVRLSELEEVLQEENSPVSLYNGHWDVPKRASLWDAVASRISDRHLEVLKKNAIKVLTEIDQRFGSPPIEQVAASIASIYGKNLIYSADLRQGLAETLALLGTHGDRLIRSGKAAIMAITSVREILKQSDWRLWARLNDLLPILAEAAPDQFLKAIDNMLRGDPSPIDEIFSREGDGIFGGNYMTGLLWSLEGLAWDEEYLSRVVILLAELAEHDPGGNWNNRPMNSLITILMPWLPQTLASVDKRLACITAIKRDFPNIAWKIVIKLLPNQMQGSFGSHKPRWRNAIHEDWKPQVSDEEYLQQVKGYSEIAIKLAVTDRKKLNELVQNLDNLPKPSFDKALEHLSTNGITNLPEQERFPIWEKLTNFVSKHRKYSNAKWALNESAVARIENVAKNLIPSSPERLYRRFFSREFFNDWYKKDRDYRSQDAIVERKRRQAIGIMLKDIGIDGILSFARDVELPEDVGTAMGKIDNKRLDEYLLPRFLNSGDNSYNRLIHGYILSCYQENGWQWVDNLNISNWDSANVNRLLMSLPFENDTWQRAEKWLGDSGSDYWKNINTLCYCRSTDDSFLAVDKLLEVGRAHKAIDCLYHLLSMKVPLDTSRIVKALLMSRSEQNSKDNVNIGCIAQLIKALQNEPNFDRNDLCNIEWVYLPILDRYHGTWPICLERRLSTDPDFFCEIIQLVYLSENQEAVKQEGSEQKTKIAHNALRLLSKWRTPPGLKEDGGFSVDDFVNWVSRVKAECEKSGHLEVAMTKIGEVLFYAPTDNDDLWIDKTVAGTLDESIADAMRRGYSIGVLNSRGVHLVDPTGTPEREISAKWRQRADAVERAGFVRFATELKKLAKEYDEQAEIIALTYGGIKREKKSNNQEVNQ